MISSGQTRLWSVSVGVIVCLYALGLGSNVFALPDSVSKLIKKMKDKKTEVRVRAAMELGRIQDPRAVEALIAALQDKGDSVRSSAAMAMADISDARVVEPLIAALRDTDYRVRDSAVFALGRKQDPRAGEALITALQDWDPEVRTSAAQALEKINAPCATEALKRFTENARRDTKSEYAIPELKPRCAVPIAFTNTDVTIESVGNSLGVSDPGSEIIMVSGMPQQAYDFTNPKPTRSSGLQIYATTWCSGARHTIKGRLNMGGYTFISDPRDPLVFRLSEDRGYVFEKGKGTVITPSHENVLLQHGALRITR